MANSPRTRKRVYPIQRAPDGSAFQKCDLCGISVAIALFDMHELECKGGGRKRFKGGDGHPSVEIWTITDQPRSPFRVFMESFKRPLKTENWIEIDRKGFKMWKNMSAMERRPYVVQAEKVNFAYRKKILKEIDYTSEVDDEADSAMVGKFDSDYVYMVQHEKWIRFESFETFEWDMFGSWID